MRNVLISCSYLAVAISFGATGVSELSGPLPGRFDRWDAIFWIACSSIMLAMLIYGVATRGLAGLADALERFEETRRASNRSLWADKKRLVREVSIYVILVLGLVALVEHLR